MTSERIVVTGVGMVSALGWSVAEAWEAIGAGREGLGPLTLFESPRCGHFPVGEVKGEPALNSRVRLMSRSDRFAVMAAREAAAQAGLHRVGADVLAEVAVVLGASTGGMLESEEYLATLMRERRMNLPKARRHECAWSTGAVAEDLGFGGFRATVCTACASGGTALATACDVLRCGEADIVLAGGVDSLTRLTLNGFSSLLVVAPDGCRPFDADRQGMSLGEGAGMLVLELEGHARSRGARILAVLAGFGITCDAHHVTAPAPDGSGIRHAMQLALAAAERVPADVDYVNAHGTGTRENDSAEGAAIGAIFGAAMPRVSSTKRFFGHTLAAAGAIEAILCVGAIERGRVPPNPGLRTADPVVPFEPVRSLESIPVRAAISNSLGFGGTNCALLFAAPAAERV